ncbi:glycosyltransferase family 4 protein [Bacteroides fragilis]
MEKIKVIIFYNQLFHYRIPIWNILAQKCDLTVTYSEGGEVQIPDNVEFKVKYLPPIKKASRFVIQKENIRELAKHYDVVIAYGDIAWLKYSTLPWFNKQKVIFWTLGVSASYDSGYDANSTWDKIRCFFYKQADAMAFYTTHPIEKYSKMGIPRERMFEAPNTVAVCPIDTNVKRDSILFIGTLYRQKGIQYLLDAYKVNKDNPNIVPLNIVGKGPDFDYIADWIKENGMENFIFMRGAIYDNEEKAKYFEKAIACISPLQTGLSVLESMGYGVPFITVKDAITGGELFNVHNGVDGILMDNATELNEIIGDIFVHKEKYLEYGRKAKDFYDNNRTPQHMADGLWKAIQFVLK